MSAEAAAARPVAGLLIDARNRRVIRYALGTTIALALATATPWTLSYMAPCVVASLLATAAPAPTLKQGLGYVGTVTVSCFVGLWSCQYFLDAPLVLLAAIGLVLLRIFHAAAGGTSAFVVAWLLIGILVIPLVAVQSPDAAILATEGIVIGGAATMVFIWVAFALVPEPAAPPPQVVQAGPKPAPPSPRARLVTATTITLVVMPMVVVFHLCAWVDGVLILGYTGLLAMNPAFAKGLEAGRGLVWANVAGGVVAILVYGILTIVPEFSYLLLLTLLAGLAFGPRVIAEHPRAPLYGRAYSTYLLVIASTTTGTGGGATLEVFQRVLQITTAVIYVVAAYGLAARFRQAREVQG